MGQTQQIQDPATGQTVNIEVVDGGPGDPFAPKNQADPSAPASQGASQEPAGSPAQGQPAAPATAPAAPAEPATSPGPTQIDPVPAIPVAPASAQPPVAPGTPTSEQTPAAPVTPAAPAAQPEPAAQPAPAPAATEPQVSMADALRQIQEQTDRQIQEALSQQQSGYDRRAAKQDEQIQAMRDQNEELVRQNRELSTRDLTDEEKAHALRMYEQQDERAELDAYRKESLDFGRTIMLNSLVKEFGAYGVTADQLNQFDEPAEMEAFCFETKATEMEKRYQEAKNAAAQPSTAPPAPAVPPATPPAPAAPATPTQAVPAGANAPSDVGGAGAAPEGPKFNPNPSRDALQQNLRAMQWSNVTPQRRQ